MELGPAEVVFDGPHHPYTEALLSAVPTIDGGERRADPAAGRDPAAPPTRRPGCVFHTRCPRKLGAICEEQRAAARRGRARAPDALPHPDRGAPRACSGRPRRGRCRRVKIRAAVLERTWARRLEVAELELDAAARRRGARAPARERRLPLRPERDRRHRRDALPGGARARGRRASSRPSAPASRACGRATTSRSRGRRPAARCAECLRDLHPPVRAAPGRRWAPAA